MTRITMSAKISVVLAIVLTAAVSLAPANAADKTTANIPQGVSSVTPLRGAVDNEFTLAILPDTQWYTATGWFFVSKAATTIDVPRMSNDGPQTFNAQTKWIANNRKKWNIVYVAHVGDIVEVNVGLQGPAECDPNNPDELKQLPDEWDVASKAMAFLEDPATTGLAEGIPFGLSIGNHDMIRKPSIDTALFNKHFSVKRFAGRRYYVEGYPAGTNDNSLQVFSAGGMDFIVVCLRYAPTDDAINWAKKKLQDYPNHGGIILSHSILTHKGQLVGHGAQIYNALKEEPNLFLMLCGHAESEAYVKQDRNNKQPVHILLSDYAGRDEEHPGLRTHDTGEGLAWQGGNGWMRLLKFSPAKNQIQVYTYSPTMNMGKFDLKSPTGQFETDADSQFMMNHKMQPRSPAKSRAK